MALAREYGFTEYAQPAGGCCFLTNATYTAKLRDLWRARGDRDYALDDVLLLKVGRHIRPTPRYKLIVGREAGENNFLAGYRRRFTHLRPVSHEGPLTLVDGDLRRQDAPLAARIVARYSQGRDAKAVTVRLQQPDGAGGGVAGGAAAADGTAGRLACRRLRNQGQPTRLTRAACCARCPSSACRIGSNTWPVATCWK